ncbi:MAG TPA: P-loop NTPase [Actinopolymorphaceae bacterium]|nr:P-loop NTPase [Actinopolymorphaceae bacterium]
MTASVVFASGKGGVGKSTIALNVAVALAGMGIRVGLVDADVYGPDIPAMVGLTRRTPARSVTLWQAEAPSVEPVDYHGVKIMSAQFLVAEDQALDWQSPLVGMLLRRLVHDVAWGELDLLLVDVPPGTGDLQQQVFQLLPDAGAVIVVTPQHTAHLDGRKLVSMLERRQITLLGGVENMSGLDCPTCGGHVALFPRVGDEHSIWSQGVRRLATIPFRVSDDVPAVPTPLVVADPDSAAGKELSALAATISALAG